MCSHYKNLDGMHVHCPSLPPSPLPPLTFLLYLPFLPLFPPSPPFPSLARPYPDHFTSSSTQHTISRICQYPSITSIDLLSNVFSNNINHCMSLTPTLPFLSLLLPFSSPPLPHGSYPDPFTSSSTHHNISRISWYTAITSLDVLSNVFPDKIYPCTLTV